MSNLRITPVKFIIHPEGTEIFSEGALTVEIMDDSAGAYIVVNNEDAGESQKGIQLDPEDLEKIQEIAKLCWGSDCIPKFKFNVDDCLKEPADLPPVVVDRIPYGLGYELVFSVGTPLVIQPKLFSGRIRLCDAYLELDVFGETVEDAVANLHEEIKMMWDEYAEASDDDLSGKSLALAKKWRMRCSCVRECDL